VVRLGSNTVSFWMYDRTYDRELAALDRLPVGARLVSFVGVPCRPGWMMSRVEHLPGLALARKLAYANDQWIMPGGQLLSSRLRDAPGYAYDPSQQAGVIGCSGREWRSLDQSLREFPRNAFDYVWLVQPPPFDPALTKGLEPLWRNGTSVLYKVVDRNPLPPKALDNGRSGAVDRRSLLQ
jgi:hypothetical protein